MSLRRRKECWLLAGEKNLEALGVHEGTITVTSKGKRSLMCSSEAQSLNVKQKC